MPRAEEMFYPLAMSSPIGVFISQEKRFRFVNPGFERATGYSKDELLHLDPMSLVLPEDREHVRVSAVKMLKGASSQPYQYRIRHKSGVVRWILETVVSMEYEGRRAVCGYFMDTSERRQAEETLRQTEERLKFIAEKANDLIYRYRRTPRPGMEYVSPSALPITGFTPEEYYANPGILRDMVHPEDQARIEAFWASPAPSTQPIAIRFQHKAGQWRWLEINRTPVLDAAGNLQAIEGIARDVTERKQAEEALSRQAEVLRNVRDGVIVATLAGEVTFWNSGATAIFGYSSQDAMGMAMVNLYPDQAPQNFQATLKDIAAGTDLSAEWRGWRKDRSTVWVNLKISVMRDEPGRPIGILAIVNDVSDKMAAREREREQNALMEAVLSSTPSALVVLNDRLEVVLANKSFLHDFPAARGMALGRPIADLLPMPPLLDAAKRVLDAGESAIGLELVHDGAGGQRTFEVNILPMSADMRAGQKINARVLISMIDATESRAAQERLYHAGRLASVGEMAAGVAHELNTPLTSVLGYAELLESVDLTDEARRDLAKIRDNAQRAAIVVRNLLTFARPSKPQRKPIQLNDEVRHVVDLRSYELHVSNIEVTLSLKRDLPRTFADPRQLQQVFLNILVNCEQAILSAKQGGRIAISTAEVDGFVRASFSDDGPGIKPENFKRLFQPFFTTKEPGKGTGLGLSISQSILAEHGGRIRAESEPGRGATFIVELPIMHEAPVHTAGAVHERNQS